MVCCQLTENSLVREGKQTGKEVFLAVGLKCRSSLCEMRKKNQMLTCIEVEYKDIAL